MTASTGMRAAVRILCVRVHLVSEMLRFPNGQLERLSALGDGFPRPLTAGPGGGEGVAASLSTWSGWTRSRPSRTAGGRAASRPVLVSEPPPFLRVLLAFGPHHWLAATLS